MVRRSRFLKQSSVPPSSGNSFSSDYSSNRSFRATSTAPSRDYRARSAAPIRASSMAPASTITYRSSGRASSLVPDRYTTATSYRASSLVPDRYATASSYRASSLVPDRYTTATSYKASSRTPYRSSSVAPMSSSSVESYSRPILRASSVAPYSTSYRSGRASSLPPKSVSFRSTPVLAYASTNSRIDTSIPTRQFGTRLGVQKMETTVKPAIYDEYYGTTYVPSGGRDSWSAYRISDETLDDNDDLVYQSAKKDYEVMKRVNKQVVEALSVPAPVFIPVAQAYKRFTPQRTPKIIHVPTEPEINKSASYRRVPAPQPNSYRVPAPQPNSYRVPVPQPNAYRVPAPQPNAYRVPAPAAKVSYSTVNDSTELLRPTSKTIANESIDLARPATLDNLKQRLREARSNMDRSKSSLNKYDTDADMRAISAEVTAIRNAREMRAKSLEPEFNQAIEDRKATSHLRKRIRSTVRSSKCGVTFK